MGNIMIVHFVGLYPPNNLVLFFMYFINYPEVYCSVGQIFRDFVEEESRFRFSNFLGGLPQWRPQCVGFYHPHGKQCTNGYVICVARHSASGVYNLSASSFINASVKVAKLSLESLQEILEGITFFQFDCMC